MRFKLPYGNSLVELALIFPLFLTLSLGVLDLIFLSVHQILMESYGHQVIRLLSFSKLKNPGEMEEFAQGWFQNKWVRPDQLSVNMEELPVQRILTVERKKKRVRVLKLEMRGRFQPRCPLLIGFLGKAGFLWSVNERGVQISSD